MNILEIAKKHLNPPKIKKSVSMDFRSIDIAPNEVPNVIEKSGSEFVWYGEANLYPDQLFDLKHGSPIHNSILKTKAKMMAGSGLLYNSTKTLEDSNQYYESLQGLQKAELDYLLNNKVGGVKLDELRLLLSSEFQDYGAYAFSYLFNKDFSKIAGVRFYKTSNIRAGKMVNGKVETYYYSKDWAQYRKDGYKPVSIKAYVKGNKDAYEQLVYRKVGTMDYYGIPSYSGGLNWIYTDFQMGVFHRGNMENGMNPGLHFKFYRKPASQEEEDEIIKNIKKQWQGAAKTGKMIATFNPDKETAMDIAPVETSNLDKQLQIVAQLCDQKILTAHQLTSPMLAGISSNNGMSSNSAELEISYQLLDGLIIESDRAILEKDIKEMFEYNKIGIPVELAKFKPFGQESSNDATEALNSLSPLVATKVLETMTQNEIRDLAGLPPVTEPVIPSITPTNNIVTNG